MGAIVSYRLLYRVFEMHSVIVLIPDIEPGKDGISDTLYHWKPPSMVQG